MKKLSDYKGEDALEIIADILEPSVEIMTDKEMFDLFKSKDTKKITLVKTMLKRHKRAVLDIFAAIEREDPETYGPNIMEIYSALLNILNDPELTKLFWSQAQKAEEKPSGSATESTAEKEV